MHINTISFPVFLSASAGHRTFLPVFFPPFEGAFATFYLGLTSFIAFQFCSIFNRTNNGLVRGLQPCKASCPKLYLQYDASPPFVAWLFTVENISSFLSPRIIKNKPSWQTNEQKIKNKTGLSGYSLHSLSHFKKVTIWTLLEKARECFTFFLSLFLCSAEKPR